MADSIMYEINAMLTKGMFSSFCCIFWLSMFLIRLKLQKFHDFLALQPEIRYRCWNVLFFHTKKPRLDRSFDLAFKTLLLLVRKLRIGGLRDINALGEVSQNEYALIKNLQEFWAFWIYDISITSLKYGGCCVVWIIACFVDLFLNYDKYTIIFSKYPFRLMVTNSWHVHLCWIYAGS